MLVFKVAVQEKDGNGLVRVASFPVNLANARDVRRIGDIDEVAKLHAVDFAIDNFLAGVGMRALDLFDNGVCRDNDGRAVVLWSKEVDPGTKHVQ